MNKEDLYKRIATVLGKMQIANRNNDREAWKKWDKKLIKLQRELKKKSYE